MRRISLVTLSDNGSYRVECVDQIGSIPLQLLLNVASGFHSARRKTSERAAICPPQKLMRANRNPVGTFAPAQIDKARDVNTIGSRTRQG